MTIKYLTTYIAAGYTIASGVTELIISPTGGVGGTGISASAFKTIFNEGQVDGHAKSYGINLTGGGDVTNGSATYTGATIKGVAGISTHGQASVTNYGVIEGIASAYGSNSAINAFDGGSVTNGQPSDRSALIEGAIGVYVAGAAGTVLNYGTVQSNDARSGVNSSIRSGVDLSYGGLVLNGTATDGTALIEGTDGIIIEKTAGFVANYGSIESTVNYAIYFGQGGGVINGNASTPAATIEGQYGVNITGGAGYVFNSGTIKALSAGYFGTGVVLKNGGTVVNGAATDRVALIQGTGRDGVAIMGGLGTVTNYGSIATGASVAVYLGAGGFVTNGALTDTGATIEGAVGVDISIGVGTVANFGSIEGLGSTTAGVTLAAGGLVTNGSGADPTALISGGQGVSIGGTAAGTVNNYGLIVGLGGAYEAGVAISGPGRVFNGIGGLIEGGQGVSLTASGFIQNNGTIRGDSNAGVGGAGVVLTGGGTVVNGTSSDRSALITGDYGVFSYGAATVSNFGTISGGYHSAGAQLPAGGSLTNGSLKDATALVSGYDGVKLVGAGSLANFGTVAGIGGYGVFLDGAGESVTNGSAGHGRATLSGYVGLQVNYGAAAVDNFGTISGYGGTALAVYPGVASAFLKVEAGCAFVGAVAGNAASTLDLASGTGTLSALTGTAVTVSGSIATTTFGNFGTVEVGAGAVFTLTGKATVLAGQTLAAAGTLTASGAVADAGILETLGGTLIISGAVTGAGSATISGGTMDFAAGFNQAVTFVTAGTLELAQSQTYTAGITGFSHIGGTSLDLIDIGFVSSTEATYSGTKTGGVLTVTDGTHTAHINLKGNYLSATFVASSDGHGGTIVVDPKAKDAAPILTPSPNAFIAAMAGLGAGAGSAVVASAHDEARGPMLARPRAQLA